MFQPVITETGWSSWARSPLRRGGRELTAPPGLRLHAGRLSVDLSDGVGLPDLRSELRGALRHLRVQDVAIRMPYMAARSDACVDYIVQPRYTLARGGFRTARLVEDLYVLDCGEQLWRLLWLVSAACLAAKDRRGSDWL